MSQWKRKRVYTYNGKNEHKKDKKTLCVLEEATWDKRLLMDLRVTSWQCI